MLLFKLAITLSMQANTSITRHLCLGLHLSDPVISVVRYSAQPESVLLSVNLGFAPGPCDVSAEEGNPDGSVCSQGEELQGVTGHWYCGLDDIFLFKVHFSPFLMATANVLCQSQGHRGCELPRAGML